MSKHNRDLLTNCVTVFWLVITVWFLAGAVLFVSAGSNDNAFYSLLAGAIFGYLAVLSWNLIPRIKDYFERRDETRQRRSRFDVFKREVKAGRVRDFEGRAKRVIK